MDEPKLKHIFKTCFLFVFIYDVGFSCVVTSSRLYYSVSYWNCISYIQQEKRKSRKSITSIWVIILVSKCKTRTLKNGYKKRLFYFLSCQDESVLVNHKLTLYNLCRLLKAKLPNLEMIITRKFISNINLYAMPVGLLLIICLYYFV